jgi:hypothetical protein
MCDEEPPFRMPSLSLWNQDGWFEPTRLFKPWGITLQIYWTSRSVSNHLPIFESSAGHLYETLITAWSNLIQWWLLVLCDRENTASIHPFKSQLTSGESIGIWFFGSKDQKPIFPNRCIYIYNYSFFASILITLISDDDVSNETHKHESLTHSSCWKQPDTHTHTKRKLHFMEDFRRANRLIVHGLPSIPRKWTCHIVVGEDIIFQKASYQNSITTVTQLLATFACTAYFGH